METWTPSLEGEWQGHFQDDFFTPVMATQGFLALLSSCGISPSRASPCDLRFSQWRSLSRQVYVPCGVWLPRSRYLRPPGETRLFLEMAPHDFGHIPLFRELTAQTRWKHGRRLLRESGKVTLQRPRRIGGFLVAIFETYSLQQMSLQHLNHSTKMP